MPQYKHFSTRDFDTSTRPADDFYQYINGGWLKRASIPPTESRWGSFNILRKNNRNRLRALLQKIVNPVRSSREALNPAFAETDRHSFSRPVRLTASSAQAGASRAGGQAAGRSASNGVKTEHPRKSHIRKLRDFYLSATDMKRRNRLGITPLNEEIERIESLKDKKDLLLILAYLHQRGSAALWHLYVAQDDKNSDRMVFRIHQDGLGMPDRDYYLKNDKDSLRVRSAYRKHMAKMFTLGKRHERGEIQKMVETVMNVETKLARASMTKVALRDVEKQYHKKTLTELMRLTPKIDWQAYLRLIGVKHVKSVIADQPAFLREVNRLFDTIPITDWKTYLYWHLLSSYADVLSADFLRESFSFNGKVIMGAKKMLPNWERGLLLVNEYMGDTLGELYVREYFPERAKRRVHALADNLFTAYRERISELDWMSGKTKKKALLKLGAIQRKIGYPSKWIRYGRLTINRDSLVENCIRAYQFEFRRDIAKLSKPTDRKEWHISPPIVNAFYSPNLNEIVFPAGILQPPFFYPEGDDAINYGAIGAIIGHELTHGFDDQGSKFDEKGNLKNWWTAADRKRFEAKSKKLVEQFNTFKVIDDMRVNGKLTLGENIADLGGLVIAYKAMRKALVNRKRKVVNGFTPEQRFFISVAVSDRVLARPEFLKMLVRNDPHAPDKFRTNAPLSNMEEFYTAFDVKKGGKMYRPEKKRVVIW